MSKHHAKHLLVTGGAGFIGTNFVRLWMDRNPDTRITVLDALTYAGNLANLQPMEDRNGYRFIHGDILDTALVERLLTEHRIDTIVHFAAESHVDRSIHGPDAFLKTNIDGTHSLLKAAKAIWLDTADTPIAHRFHHVSTDEVYGSLEADEAPFTEGSQYQPNSPYAASKAASDHLVRAYHHTYGLNVTTSNCSNNYGPYQFPEKLIPLVIINILHGKALPIYGDGLNVRDWLYVDDHNIAIETIIKEGRSGEVYNIGGNNEWTNIDIVRLICQRLDALLSQRPDTAARFPNTPIMKGARAESLITYVKDRLGHDRRYAINAEKLQTGLGFSPVYNFESGIEQTLDWYLGNETWWQQVMDGSYRDWLQQHYEH